MKQMKGSVTTMQVEKHVEFKGIGNLISNLINDRAVNETQIHLTAAN